MSDENRFMIDGNNKSKQPLNILPKLMEALECEEDFAQREMEGGHQQRLGMMANTDLWKSVSLDKRFTCSWKMHWRINYMNRVVGCVTCGLTGRIYPLYVS